MIYRIYSEKKKELAYEAKALLTEARDILGIACIDDIRILNRYDVENIDEDLFKQAVRSVFSQPETDIVSEKLESDGGKVFAVEFLPGQFDQRADSASQCIQIISQGVRPLVSYAKVYVLYGDVSYEGINKLKNYVINPVEAREASLEIPETLTVKHEIPTEVDTLFGFIDMKDSDASRFVKDYALAMDEGDVLFCRDYFKNTEKRDPTITEIRVIDTYWSDHCRHTTFNTIIDSVRFEDEILEDTWKAYLETRKSIGRTKPICLMDIGTIACKYLKENGLLDMLDESEEINACTVKINVETEEGTEPWLLLFKNETHNHPTEIEPFGGAATCIGGAIRDPLSGRSYVYGAMRVTGAADPTVPIEDTLSGKLPQRKIVASAAEGYSSYGNQIGLATGIVDEIYHPGYVAKRMEIGAVIAAAPEKNVIRKRPEAGDVIIYLGGSTGRDGIGGATGSSKAHNVSSVTTLGAEVQKGNALEERKLQRLFRNPEASRLIVRCNDFGAGGVSVAIGELAEGLDIDLNVVPKKYDGLDGTELAISESQERMAVCVRAKDAERFLELAKSENLQAVIVARVKEDPRLTMTWNGKKIVDISRAFLDTNGAEKHINIEVPKAKYFGANEHSGILKLSGSFSDDLKNLVSNLNICSKRGLSERFDSTIGAGTVLMPFGGSRQLTPIQAMVQKIPAEKKHTDNCSLMAYGFNPFISEKSPYHGAYLAVIESVSKLIAQGAEFKDVCLTFQEYFPKPGADPKRFGLPFAALLGAFKAQMDLKVAAIGGKDSMSGTFENLDVPPTLVSFAVTCGKASDVVSGEFKGPGHAVYLIEPDRARKTGLFEAQSLIRVFNQVTALMRKGAAISAYTPGMGGVAEAIFKMSIGNGVGFKFSDDISEDDLFSYRYGSFILEMSDLENVLPGAIKLGETTDNGFISYKGDSLDTSELLKAYEDKLEGVYSCNITPAETPLENFSYKADSYPSPAVKIIKPKMLIPAFPGTNCEYDSAKAASDAGLNPEIVIIKNLSAEDIKESVRLFASKLKDSQMIFIPGGFSGADEPDGSAKFITAFFRNEEIKDEVTRLLDDRCGLILGICNGFQALIKLGLVPYGKIVEPSENMPTLTFNTIARHQSKIVRTRIASNKSPWLIFTEPGEIYTVPISHGEGRFLADEEFIRKLAANGQIATQYADLKGCASNDIRFNPNGSVYAVEGITSPDGRVFGKMGHAERAGENLYKNVPGNYDMRLFEAAARYFR